MKELFDRTSELVTDNADEKFIKAVRKKIRLRARHLKNEHFRQKAEKINNLAVNRKLEQLFHKAGNQETTFRSADNSCPSETLIKHFKSHFNPADPSKSSTPDELRDPLMLQVIQHITNNL